MVLTLLLRDSSVARGYLRDRNVPPRVAARRIDQRIRFDVHDGRAVRRLRLGKRTAQLIDGMCTQHVRTEALCVGRQVRGKRVTGEPAAGVAVAVRGTETLCADGFRETGDGCEAMILHQDDDQLE